MYEGWENYQQLLIQALAPLTPEQLAVRPGGRLRSIGENAAHIVGARAGWVYYVLGREEARLQPLTEWQGRPDQPAQTATAIIEGLRVTWQAIEAALQAWSPADLEELVQDTDEAGNAYTVTRRWVIWHLIEHDIHHGGEISVALGIAGLPGIAL
jgi:uncharacterized damage-inducible protein DinB